MRCLCFCVVLAVCLGACRKGSPIADLPPNKNTILIVMEANNDLKYEAFRAINDIEYGMAKDWEGSFFVCLRSQSEKSVLLKIR